jgi:phosphoserine phosphatase
VTTTAPTTIALVFDFDDTLAPDSTSQVLEAVGIEPAGFWSRHRRLMSEGWDQVAAWMHMMLDESARRGGAITRDVIERVGQDLRFFPGVPSMFERYRELIEADGELAAHFYVISSGLGDLIRATTIARHLTDAWGSDFAYDGSGAIDAIKNVISFTDKTRYLFQISKGIIGPGARANPFAVNDRVLDYPVRKENMIYVGDGYTDIPCFHLVQDNFGGVALGVFDAADRSKIGKARGLVKAERVGQINSADFREGGGADSSIKAAIASIKSRAREVPP